MTEMLSALNIQGSNTVGNGFETLVQHNSQQKTSCGSKLEKEKTCVAFKVTQILIADFVFQLLYFNFGYIWIRLGNNV